MEQTLVKGEAIKKTYHRNAEDVEALKGVDFEIASGDFVAVMGPSGSGKTTFLDVVGCLDNLTSGKLEISGQDVSKLKDKGLTKLRRKTISFIFQRSFLIPTLTALENVKLPLIFARLNEKQKKAEELLDRVGLDHRMHHLPRELSGGEMQRVAIARALVTDPEILLADEPTGNLDTKNGQQIFDLFKKFNESGLTIIVATHDEGFGRQAKRILYLHDGVVAKPVNR